jgi:hypothetical protein
MRSAGVLVVAGMALAPDLPAQITYPDPFEGPMPDYDELIDDLVRNPFTSFGSSPENTQFVNDLFYALSRSFDTSFQDAVGATFRRYVESGGDRLHSVAPLFFIHVPGTDAGRVAAQIRRRTCVFEPGYYGVAGGNAWGDHVTQDGFLAAKELPFVNDILGLHRLYDSDAE